MTEENKKSKKHYAFLLSSEHGRSQCVIECPFCKHRVTAYLWSLAGSGKMCPECGAKHVMGFSVERNKKRQKALRTTKAMVAPLASASSDPNCEYATSP